MRPELLANGDFTLETLGDLLSLVCEDLPPCAGKWSDLERRVVADWAGREHLAASDNLNKRRDRPHLLDCQCTGAHPSMRPR